MNDIEVNNFMKKYGDVAAVHGVSISVKPGELFGLIGPDGAGKTTLMRAICTLLIPDGGTIHVKGLDVTREISRTRSILGYMPQRFSLYQDLTVEQNLQFFADLFQVTQSERNKRLSQLFQFSRLEPFKKRTAGALSGGMKQKLALSCALIHTPQILVLDEPTFGVDPVSRGEFWDILRAIQKEGTTILVSTAYMDEADQCDRVVLLFDGNIKASGRPEELRANYKFPLYRIQAADLRAVAEFFQSNKEVHATQLFGDSLHVSFNQAPQDAIWHKWVKITSGNIKNWQLIPPSIEDIFLDLIGDDK
jgi:ABC-2 type transport system ATP-binding protein